MERLRGYTVAEAMQQTIDEALTPASAKKRTGRNGASPGSDTNPPEGPGLPRRAGAALQTRRYGLDRGAVLLHVQRASEFVNFLGVTRDISERKRTELDLQIAAIAFESQDGMMVTDAHKTILRVNHAFSQISGYAPHEVIGKTPRVLRSDRHPPISTMPYGNDPGRRHVARRALEPTQER